MQILLKLKPILLLNRPTLEWQTQLTTFPGIPVAIALTHQCHMSKRTLTLWFIIQLQTQSVSTWYAQKLLTIPYYKLSKHIAVENRRISKALIKLYGMSVVKSQSLKIIVLNEKCIVVPATLHSRIFDIAQESLPGMTHTKALLCLKGLVWIAWS